jgi:hypothetical protein
MFRLRAPMLRVTTQRAGRRAPGRVGAALSRPAALAGGRGRPYTLATQAAEGEPEKVVITIDVDEEAGEGVIQADVLTPREIFEALDKVRAHPGS